MSDFERALAVAAAAYDGLIDENGEPLIAGLLTQAMRAKTWRTRTLELLRWAIIDAGVTRAQLEAVGIDGNLLNVLFPSHLPATYAVKPELMGDPVDVQLIIGATKPALLLRAASFAAHKHRDQRRKDARASPYINHPLMLADILASEGSVTDTVTLCAALLHDTIEDTETKPDELRELFGPEIAAVVVEVTDDKTSEKADRKRLQVEHASVISDKAKLVKLADKIANIRDVVSSPPADWSLDRKRDYFDWAKRVIDQLRGVHPQLEAAFDGAYACRP